MPEPATALCPACHVPLICTFAFPRFEFYCLDCGRHLDWLEPEPGNAVEHEADYQARLAEWMQHAGAALITPQSKLVGCERCSAGGWHAEHVTAAEILADQNARRWLITRQRT